ncbi:hypothetical protein FRB96_006899 [Tulasnella sp. 330]|nr:hypothetical protein FRB96_006899 [Tulasnella sp. 330]KAG8879622.1 hypothetical protein FRB97_001586 [Tulasnella sp. 331]
MSFNIHQQVYGLSLNSNYLTNVQNTPLSKMQTMIETALPDLVKAWGPWKVVWGPVVWQDATSTIANGPDNVWYVAYNESLDTYVIAIAGTATFSAYDIWHEDGEVNAVVDLSNWLATWKGVPGAFTALQKGKVDDSGKAYISVGTARGLSALLTNQPRITAQGSGMYLQDFLGTISATSTLIFTGHSLGGALAPALALAWWMSTMPRNVQLTNVKTFPTAGPSPGNQKFVETYEANFPVPANPTGYQNWNVNLVNTLDVVPQAWCDEKTLDPDQNLHRITRYYDGTLKCKLELAVIIGGLVYCADLSGVIYRPLKSSKFTGSDWPVKKPNVVVDSKDPTKPCWLNDALFEHIGEYAKCIGVPTKAAVSFGLELDVQEVGTIKSKVAFAESWPVLHWISVLDVEEVQRLGIPPVDVGVDVDGA